MVTHRLNPPPAARSGARNLREMGEVCIAAAEHQSVLQDERRDPQQAVGGAAVEQRGAQVRVQHRKSHTEQVADMGASLPVI